MGRHRPTPPGSPLETRADRRAERRAAARSRPAAGRTRGPRRRRGGGRARHTSVGVLHTLGGLPWVTMVLLALVVAAAVGVLRQDMFSASSTMTAATPLAGSAAAVDVTRSDVVPRLEEEVELDEKWRGDVTITVERHPDRPHQVVVRAQAPDPRLAALAADTVAARQVEENPDLTLTATAVTPTAPVRQVSWRAWILGGLGALALAALLEWRHDRRQTAQMAGEVA